MRRFICRPSTVPLSSRGLNSENPTADLHIVRMALHKNLPVDGSIQYFANPAERVDAFLIERNRTRIEQDLIDEVDTKIIPRTFDLNLTIRDFLLKQRDAFHLRGPAGRKLRFLLLHRNRKAFGCLPKLR
jgi:hypothetical protein